MWLATTWLAWQQQQQAVPGYSDALLLGLGTILGGLLQAVFGLVRDHRKQRVTLTDHQADRLDKRIDAIMGRQDGEIARIGAELKECIRAREEFGKLVVELRERLLHLEGFRRWDGRTDRRRPPRDGGRGG